MPLEPLRHRAVAWVSLVLDLDLGKRS
jgi:hypothetical protein